MSESPSRQAGASASDSAAIDPAFLRLLAHELRNYIAPMHNAMHLLRMKTRADPGLAPVIDIAERQLGAMSGTLDAVSEMEQVRRGEVALERARVSVRDIVDRAVRSLPATARRDRLVLDMPEALTEIEVDAARMARVIANLIDNALRYAPGDSPVRVHARDTQAEIEIAIEDRGPGMDASSRDKALEFFASAHQPGHGLGLSLPLAAAFLRLHEGALCLESAPGGGLRVVLRLPRVAGPAGREVTTPIAVEDVAARDERVSAGRRVLLADDSAAVRTSLTDLLQEMGHEVRAVADGAEAVSVAQSWNPEFVLLDIHMPKLNGFDAARKLRALYPVSTMQLVMMSGEGLDDVVRRGARQAGFDHCVDKGLAIGELTALLARAPAAGKARKNSL